MYTSRIVDNNGQLDARFTGLVLDASAVNSGPPILNSRRFKLNGHRHKADALFDSLREVQYECQNLQLLLTLQTSSIVLTFRLVSPLDVSVA